MLKTFSLLTLALFSLFQFGSAQTHMGLKSGKIVFEISYKDPNMDENNKAMMPKESIMYFKDDKMRVEVSMAMGTTVIISDNVSQKSTVLMDFMGKKIAMETNQEQTKKEMEKSGKIKVEKLPGSKVIAGYTCKKAKITQTTNGKESSFDVWYTNEISAKNSYTNGFEGIDGCMLEFEIFQSGMQMKLTTKSISKEEVSSSMFIIPDGYTITTADGLKTLLGGGY